MSSKEEKPPAVAETVQPVSSAMSPTSPTSPPSFTSSSAATTTTTTEDHSQPVKRPFWRSQVDTAHGDLALLACCFVQGLLDCTVFHNWAVFVGMQTGNTVILCLSTARLPEGQPWSFGTTLISICSFFIGAFVTTRVCTALGPRRRLVLAGNFLAQALLIVVAAALTSGRVTVTDASANPLEVLRDPRILIGVAPLAWQSGATIATSRMIGYGNEIPVTVFTSTYAALAGDPRLFAAPRANAARNRRLAAVACILGGALSSTWLEKRSIGMQAVVWFAAGLKLVLSCLVGLLLPSKVESKAAEKGKV